MTLDNNKINALIQGKSLKDAALAMVYAHIEDMGLYPAQMSRPDGSGYEKRTEFMDGWNAALIEITRRLACYEEPREAA